MYIKILTQVILILLNTYIYIDELAAVILQRMVVNEKKINFLINIVAEQTGMFLTSLNASHEQKSNDLYWVHTLAKEIKKDYDIWLGNKNIKNMSKINLFNKIYLR